MKIPKCDLKIETMRGTGPGGQHRNKTDSAVRITHRPSGISAYADERSQSHSRRVATRELKQRLQSRHDESRAAKRKADRDRRIQPATAVRTYDFKSGTVTDHRTGKKASVKNILGKGKLELLR